MEPLRHLRPLPSTTGPLLAAGAHSIGFRVVVCCLCIDLAVNKISRSKLVPRGHGSNPTIRVRTVCVSRSTHRLENLMPASRMLDWDCPANRTPKTPATPCGSEGETHVSDMHRICSDMGRSRVCITHSLTHLLITPRCVAGA